MTAYNAGLNGLVRAVRRLGTRDPGEVLRRHRSRIFGFASRNFYTEFLAAATIYENRDRFFPGVEPDPPLRFDRFVPDSYVAVGDLAAVAGISLETLRALNPGLSSEIWQGNLLWPEGYELRVPAGRLPDVQSAYRALPEAARSDRQTGFRYRVRRGDTLSVLARRFGTSVAAIQRANRLSRADFIREGQLLLIPPGGRVSVRYLPEGEAQAGGVHLVRSGDTLWAIAGRYGSCVEAIRSANDLSSSRIYAGQRLQIPPPSACSGAA